MYNQKVSCGLTKTLDVIGGKWTVLIVRDLLASPKRFGELEDSLDGISPRTLAARLKELEADLVIERLCPAGSHPVYQLTAKGRSLQQIIAQLSAWGETR